MLINADNEKLAHARRGPLRRLLIMLAALPLVCGIWGSAALAEAAEPADLSVAVDVTTLTVSPTPCSVGRLTVRLTNNGPDAVYGDAFVQAEGFDLSARLISSYLPSGYTWVEHLQVAASEGTDAGEHELLVTAGDSTARVDITVEKRDLKGNLAPLGTPTASSVYGGREPCGALDGNKDSEQWSNGVGWSDGTNSVFPDWWQVTFDQPVTVSRVDLYTLDSIAIPASAQGLSDWRVQVPDGDGWRTVATVSDNKLAMVSTIFAAETTTALRILCDGAGGNYSRILELEAYA